MTTKILWQIVNREGSERGLDDREKRNGLFIVSALLLPVGLVLDLRDLECEFGETMNLTATR